MLATACEEGVDGREAGIDDTDLDFKRCQNGARADIVREVFLI